MALGDLSSPQAVERALDEFDELGRDAFLEKYGFGRARRYFIRRDGSYYDSKAIAGAAVGFEHPERGPLQSEEFSGGEHGAKAKLEELGFEVVPRPALAAADELPLREALEAALVALAERTAGEWSDDLQKAIAVTLPNAIRATVGDEFRVKGSAGAGNQAEIPWVSVMPPGLKGASEGRYIVYLFAADGGSVFLSLSQAVTGQRKDHLPELARELREAAGAQEDLLGQIELGAHNELGQRYALATAYALEYRRGALPEEAELESDLNRFLGLLDRVSDDAPTLEARSWIFQASPRYYEIDRALRELKSIEFTARQNYRQIHSGDRAYIWRSGPQAGIVAVARIANEPVEKPPDERERPYFIDASDFSKPELRVALEIVQVLERPLLATTLAEDPALVDLQILRFRNATVFGVEPEQAARLAELTGSTDRDETYVNPDLPSISAAIRVEGLDLDDETLRRYHLSLNTRRGFVILAGVSGTGKTWLAEAYARAVGGRLLVVPVAPNWTTNEDLLGYRNPLDQQYYDTDFSQFLRDAAAEYERRGSAAQRYHLVLDEMNLARVEYYFAKFLSAMEQRARSNDARIELAPDDAVQLPANLYVTGTINVDETTHAFSDKVYDRAQLIELPVLRADLARLLEGRPYAEILLSVWDELHVVAPFAYRVVDEINEYVADAEAAGATWETALDEQLLQKVLPKIKGTDLRLRGVLERFIQIAADHFPLSAAKAETMLAAFTEHGFTSYF